MAPEVSVVLVYDSPTGKPIMLARSDDRRLLVRVAMTAIGEAQARAEIFKQTDETLGTIEREEAIRLERLLNRLVPELATPAVVET